MGKLQVLYLHSILILAAAGYNVHSAAPSRLAAITDNGSEAGYQHVYIHQQRTRNSVILIREKLLKVTAATLDKAITFAC